LGGGLHEADEWVSVEALYQVLEIYVRFLLEGEI
jgi:acetylornithine deacetylase/succinyl-diaminopimelate desuccinylase-like protein